MIRWAAVVASSLVAAAALFDVWIAVRPGRAPISEASLAAAVARVRQTQAPGDLVVHSPLMTVRELASFEGLSASPDRPLLAQRARRRVVAIDFERFPMFGLGIPATEIRLDEGLVLRTFAPTKDAVGAVWRLARDLDATTMVVERRAGERPCSTPRPEGGFRCAGEPEWLYAAERVLRVGRQDRACVWAHPTTGGTVVFRVPALVATEGRRLQLRLGAGLVDDAVVHTPNGAAVVTEVHQDGRPLGRIRVPNRIGWFDATYDVRPNLPLQLRVTTRRDGRRHYCMTAAVVEVD